MCSVSRMKETGSHLESMYCVVLYIVVIAITVNSEIKNYKMFSHLEKLFFSVLI